MDGAQVGVFEESNEVGFRGFLKGEDGAALESELGFDVVSDFSDESLEWKFSDEEVSRLLVSPDFSEGDGSWAESVGLLDASGGGGSLSGSLGGKLFSGDFRSG